MSSWAKLLTTLALLSLPACGFTPMYHSGPAGNQAYVSAGLNDVDIGNIPDREGQYLRNALIDRFYRTGRPAFTRYQLGVDEIAETITDLDITKSADATRAQLRLRTDMTLTDTSTGEIVLRRDLTSITSYNILQSQFTTRVSEDAARKNALDELARQIEQQLALYFKRNK